MCLKNKCFKDNNKLAHWVGHLKLGSLDTDEFFKRKPKFDEKEASVTGKTEKEKNTAKNTTDDVDTNAEDNEIIHKDKVKVIKIEEDRNTLEYQEIINLEIENNSSTSQQIWGSIYEVIHYDYLKQ